MDKAELKLRRERLGLTQTEFAKVLGVVTNTVSRYETGQNEIPAYMALTLEALEARQIEKLKAPFEVEK